MRKLIFTPKALRKISQIEAYISTEFSPGNAKEFKRILKNRIRSLKVYPFQGKGVVANCNFEKPSGGSASQGRGISVSWERK
jgi:plasmid stabilization system protein ParE